MDSWKKSDFYFIPYKIVGGLKSKVGKQNDEVFIKM